MGLHLSAFLAILALATVLRFYGLAERGYIYWDEGKFALEGIRFDGAIHAMLGAQIDPNVGKAVGTAKPTHALLIGFADSIVGVRDYAALILNAAASVVGVVLTYLIGRRLFDPLIGLLSSLFLAVSEYDVIYARSALSESDANALFLAGLLMWATTRTRAGHVAAGLLLGLSFTANYRLIVYCVVLVAYDVLWQWRRAGFTSGVRAGLLWLFGLAIVPLHWQVTDLMERGRGLVLFRSEVTHQPIWYLQQALYQLHEGRQAAIHFHPLQYLHWYVLREGWPVALLALAGLGLITLQLKGKWKRSAQANVPRAPVVAFLVVIPYVIYTFAPFDVARNLSATIPFISIAAAVGLCQLVRTRVPMRALLPTIAAATLLVGGLGAVGSWRLTSARSGFARAAAHVSGQHQGRALVSNEIMMFYLPGSGRGCTAPRIPRSPADLRADFSAGYRIAVLDKFNRSASRVVRDTMPLLARYPLGASLALGENLVISETGAQETSDNHNDYVSVYKLVLQRLPRSQHRRAPVCDRNSV